MCNAYLAVAARGVKLKATWNDLLTSYGHRHPTKHADFTCRIAGKLTPGWDATQASRKLLESVLSAIVPVLSEMGC